MILKIAAHAAVALLAACALAGCNSMTGSDRAYDAPLACYSNPGQPRVSPTGQPEQPVARPQMSDTALPVRKQY